MERLIKLLAQIELKFFLILFSQQISSYFKFLHLIHEHNKLLKNPFHFLNFFLFHSI